jgi:hypothetical protein
MHRTKEQLGLPPIPEPYSERRPGGCGTRRWYMTEALVASLMLGVATPAAAEFACSVPEFLVGRSRSRFLDWARGTLWMCRLNAGIRGGISRETVAVGTTVRTNWCHWPSCFCDRRKLVHAKGNMQSPLETPVQRLRNTRLVEEICAWTEATPPFHL